MQESSLEPDAEQVAERRPTSCPFCDYSGAFDGQGVHRRELRIRRAGIEDVFETVWHQHRCPECNGTFQMRSNAEKVDR